MKEFFRSTRLRLIMLVLLAVVPALALTLFTGFEVRNQATQKALLEESRLVRVSADSYTTLINSAQQLLSGLALLPQVIDREPGCDALLTSMLKEFPEYTNLAVADPQGNIFCSGVPLAAPIQIADRGYFKQVMATGKFAVSDYVVSRETHKSAIVIAHPAIDPANGQVRAVITASVDLLQLGQMIDAAQLPPNSVFFMMDRQGTYLVRDPNPQQWVGKQVPESDVAGHILGQKTAGTIEAQGADNTNRLYAYQIVRAGPNDSSYMAIGIPTSSIYAEANHLLDRNLIALGIVAVLAFIAAWLMGDFLIFRPIKPLLYAAECWTAGDYNVRVGTNKGPAEFARLSNAYNRMAEAITHREEQIRQAEREAAESATRIKIQTALIDQREKERFKIARDLHDGPVQDITAAAFLLQDLLMGDFPPNETERLKEIRAILSGQIRELRDYAGELRSSVLSNSRLGNAIRSHLDNYHKKHPEFQLHFEEMCEGETLPEEKKVALYRIYQELMNNVAKHSQASEIRINLTYLAEEVDLKVTDNGLGFTVTNDWLELANQGHLGLVGIQERAEAIGGKVEIQSAPGQGTSVLVRVFLNK